MFNINLLAVLVAAVAVFAIGMVWYSPALLGRQWMTAHGYTPDKLAAMKATVSRAYVVSFVCYLVMGAALAVLIRAVSIGSIAGGIRMGGLVWLGFAAPLGLTANMFSEKPLATWLIDAGYQLVYLIAMGAILAAWR